MGPTGESRILQIHPTRQCNLRCLHCYSSSSPEERGGLDAALLCGAISDAAQEEYGVVSISGGEPLLYKDLATILTHAKSCGLRTTVTTNGMLLTKRRLAALKDCVDILAISLDGVPDSHNRIRGSRKAFDTMASRLDAVRSSGIAFGFIFTLTQYNLDELQWVAEFALEQGAGLLQLHPLETVGRAAEEMTSERPDEMEGSVAWLEAVRIQQQLAKRLFVQVDLVNRRSLPDHPERVYADAEGSMAGLPLARLVSPLVIEADGRVAPIAYGFGDRYSLGNIHESSLRDLARKWEKRGLIHFRSLCRQVFDSAVTSKEMPFFNWYEELTAASQESLHQSLSAASA